jgi:hypothetical protein
MSTKKTGKQYMNEFIASKGMVRLVDLKKGDKFYGHDWDDPNIYELLDLVKIQGEPNTFKYTVRILGTKIMGEHTISGQGVVNRTVVCRYRTRDRGSFVAGFKAAMHLYQKHMQVFDRENAGLDESWNVAMTMNQEYRKWMKGFD